MSKRYGRNQKRRHRERIAALEEAYNRDVPMLQSSLAKVRRERDEIVETVTRRLPFSAMLPPRTLRAQINGAAFCYPRLGRYDDPPGEVRVDLHKLEVAIEEDIERLLYEIHVRLESRGCYYAVSRQVLAEASYRGVIEHHVAQEVARRMGETIGKKVPA